MEKLTEEYPVLDSTDTELDWSGFDIWLTDFDIDV